MGIRERIGDFLRSLSIEFIAIWYLFWDRRITWYAKLLLLLPITYVVSPLDLLVDTLPLWGQIDDLVVLRISYLLIRKIASPEVLAECRARATAFWDGGSSHRAVFCAALVLAWGLALVVLARSLLHRIVRHA